MFMDDHSNAVIAPSGAFFGLVNKLNCDNPLMQSALCVPAAYNAADANLALDANGDPVYQSTFGNLIGQSPIFDPNNPNSLLGFTNPRRSTMGQAAHTTKRRSSSPAATSKAAAA